jgi:hypothetical protein
MCNLVSDFVPNTWKGTEQTRWSDDKHLSNTILLLYYELAVCVVPWALLQWDWWLAGCIELCRGGRTVEEGRQSCILKALEGVNIWSQLGPISDAASCSLRRDIHGSVWFAKHVLLTDFLNLCQFSHSNSFSPVSTLWAQVDHILNVTDPGMRL